MTVELGHEFFIVPRIILIVPSRSIVWVNRVAVLYKDKEGRKLVAIGTDGTPMAKNKLQSVLRVEFSRSYSEISDSLLTYMKRRLPDVLFRYAIPFHIAHKITRRNGDEITRVNDYEYSRILHGKPHTKLMIGTIGNNIV